MSVMAVATICCNKEKNDLLPNYSIQIRTVGDHCHVTAADCDLKNG